jgi:hypothetical protein
MHMQNKRSQLKSVRRRWLHSIGSRHAPGLLHATFQPRPMLRWGALEARPAVHALHAADIPWPPATPPGFGLLAAMAAAETGVFTPPPFLGPGPLQSIQCWPSLLVTGQAPRAWVGRGTSPLPARYDMPSRGYLAQACLGCLRQGRRRAGAAARRVQAMEATTLTLRRCGARSVTQRCDGTLTALHGALLRGCRSMSLWK